MPVDIFPVVCTLANYYEKGWSVSVSQQSTKELKLILYYTAQKLAIPSACLPYSIYKFMNQDNHKPK